VEALTTVRYVIGERTLKLMLEGRLRVLHGRRLRYGRYRIVRRYVVKGVVVGCPGEGQGLEGR